MLEELKYFNFKIDLTSGQKISDSILSAILKSNQIGSNKLLDLLALFIPTQPFDLDYDKYFDYLIPYLKKCLDLLSIDDYTESDINFFADVVCITSFSNSGVNYFEKENFIEKISPYMEKLSSFSDITDDNLFYLYYVFYLKLIRIAILDYNKNKEYINKILPYLNDETNVKREENIDFKQKSSFAQ